jgi:acyl-CoA synthetase (AMP-forming)/AMP-acid ligase II
VMLVDTRIVGPDGTDSAAGQIGELVVRGPNVMACYWNRPDATRRVFDEHGWLHPYVAEACVVGGEQGAVAYVVRAEGAPAEIESDLLALCRGRLAPSACPAAIRFVGALPRNANGKIVRRKLYGVKPTLSQSFAVG